MQIQCECGKFRAEIETFPDNTPGECVCYCDDCQTYAHHIGRADLLDAHGGSAIVPVYPKHIKVLSGREQLRCTHLSPKGLERWWTACCRTPIANTKGGIAWAGLNAVVFRAKNPQALRDAVGPVKARINAKFARNGKPEGGSEKTSFRDFLLILPFVLKGFFFKLAKGSPFYQADGVTPIHSPETLTLEMRNAIRRKLGFAELGV